MPTPFTTIEALGGLDAVLGRRVEVLLADGTAAAGRVRLDREGNAVIRRGRRHLAWAAPSIRVRVLDPAPSAPASPSGAARRVVLLPAVSNWGRPRY